MATTETQGAQQNKQKEQGIGLGLLTGLSVTLRTMLKRSVTVQYPHVKPDLPARTRGVIALKEANCTVCYKCSRECPDWCIYIDAHKETHPPASGGRARSAKILDRFAIDYALCMYCGICVEVCPFDALFWSPEFEYSESRIANLLHDKDRLGEWMATVPPPPALDEKSAEPAEIAASNKPARGTGLVGAGGAAAGGPGARMPRTVRPRPAAARPEPEPESPDPESPEPEPPDAT